MLVKRQALDYLRVSICVCGGFTGAKKIAAIAEANHLGIIPHNPLSPVATAACIQLDAAVPCFTIQEYPGSERTGSPRAFRVREDWKIRVPCLRYRGSYAGVQEGFLIVPDSTGTWN